MPLAARRVARRGVVGPRPSLAPRPSLEPRPSWPTVSTAVRIVARTARRPALTAAAEPTARGGRDEPKSSRDRLPDQGSRQRQGAHRRAAAVDARFREGAGRPRTVHFSRFMVEGDEKLLFLSDIDGEGAPAYRAARGACRPGVRRHLRTRGRPSGHARGGRPSAGHQMAEGSCPRAARYVLRVRGRFGAGHQGVRACGGLHRQYLAEPAADVHDHQVRCKASC